MPGSPVATSKSLGLALFSLTLPVTHHPSCPKNPDNYRVQVGTESAALAQSLLCHLPRPEGNMPGLGMKKR